ncbi:MBOAT family protein [Rubellimicrobium rubrum]|uniref:Probable alginate O-acetylase AlgI n=1 Tax=Rubellimicrobium rubrum TaxID=2585369 RepID=A0A5C4N0I7_9RHOB|nr:MBOAT family protein [Rubellimicrobium rubrum]TNC50871.1 MBOAT family protein [Rubellimicrobium rubrum]
MVFSSEVFLFGFLPAFLAIYYLTPMRWRNIVILIGSYGFYGWWRLDFLGLLILTTLWTYAFGRLMMGDPARRKLWITIGVVGCLSVLGVFKYLNFFIDSFAALFSTTPEELGVHWRLLLPIGVSFYVFHCISYLVDMYRGDVEEDVGLVNFAAFIVLFPQLVAGPILRFKDLAHQFKHRTHSLDLFLGGLMLFFVGLAKKVLLADAVAPLADLAFQTPDPSFALAWGGAVAYMMQLYFDFSGYSDMAVGLGMMIGFRLIRNFATPYHSHSITEFWNRWHISLSTWLRDYLYIPLGGNRVGRGRTYVNLFMVMALGGLWHGAAWTFVLWGFWHGGWLVLERATGLAKANGAGAVLRTLFLVLIGWVLFRAANVEEALHIYAGMFGLNGFGVPAVTALSMTGESLAALALCVGVAALEPYLGQIAREQLIPQPGSTLVATNTLVPTLLVTGLAALAIMKLAEQSFSPFLYFQF